MAHKDDHIACLQAAIKQTHHCDAVHIQTVSVHEAIGGQTIWKGDVEVFDLHGNTVAKKCFAWLYHEKIGERFVTVLETEIISSAAAAVKYAIFFDMQPAPYPRHQFTS